MFTRSQNIRDVHARLKREYKSLSSYEIPCLATKYDNQRRKETVPAKKIYARAFPVKSLAGNNWLVFMQKSFDAKEYVDKKSINICAVTYHYCEAGIRAFHLGENDTIVGFNPHFFERYNERMKLGLQLPIDIVKAFFRNGSYCKTGLMNNGGKKHPVGFRKDGMQLGEYHIQSGYMEWRTFISKDLTFKDQRIEKKKLMKQDYEQKTITIQPIKPFKKIRAAIKNQPEAKPVIYKSFEGLYESFQRPIPGNGTMY